MLTNRDENVSFFNIITQHLSIKMVSILRVYKSCGKPWARWRCVMRLYMYMHAHATISLK